MQGRLRQRQMEAQHPKGKWDFERDQLPNNTHVTLRPLKGQWLRGRLSLHLLLFGGSG